MSKLTSEQQQLVLDFYFRCGGQQEIEAGRDLIASSPPAAKLYADLETSLTDLDSNKYEACPDNLVDLTIARLKLAASSSTASPSRLHQLIEKERYAYYSQQQDPDQPSSHSQTASAYHQSKYLRPVFEILATAAAIILIAGILVPSFGFVRDKYRQVACENNMRVLGAGFASFNKDFNGNLPNVQVKAGDPWWKIGDQGQNIHSNTRYPFMLIKLDYVDGKVFVCKGRDQAEPVKKENLTAETYDFPSRHNISYSFMLFNDKNCNPMNGRRKIIASDLNPVFQKIPCQRTFYQSMNEFEKVLIDKQLRQIMSTNHRGSGQNVLYCDGSVKFVRERVIGGDDIFTVRGVDAYTGRETPDDDDDTFLVP